MDELTMQDLRDAFADKAESKGMEIGSTAARLYGSGPMPPKEVAL